jgi:hypothetical protein
LYETAPWHGSRALCSPEEKEDRVQRFIKKATLAKAIDVRVLEMTGDAGDVFWYIR